MNYGMISFRGAPHPGPFYSQILNGRKTQTMRTPRDDGRVHVKVGHWCPFYWRVRRKKSLKPVHFIGYALITEYTKTSLLDVWFDEENAKADGFKDLAEFRKWFYPEWEILPQLYKDAVEAVKTLKDGEEVVTDVLIAGSRMFGKVALMKLIDYLREPIYVIKWNQVSRWDVPMDKFKVQASYTEG